MPLRNTHILVLTLTTLLVGAACSVFAAPGLVKNPKQFMKKTYLGLSGYSHEVRKDKAFSDTNAADSTYGEITYRGAAHLLDDLEVTSNDVVYDMGSGIGKFVVQTYLTTNAKRVVGIELSKYRADQAAKVRAQLEKDGIVVPNRHIDFIEDNFLNTPMNDATIVYLCSTTWPAELMKKVTTKLSSLPDGLRVVTTKALPPSRFFVYETEKPYSFSWSSKTGSPVYFYRLRKNPIQTL